MGASLEKEVNKLKAKNPTELDLKDRGISEIPQNIEQLDQLVKLNLSNNKLTSLPPQIGNLGTFSVLTLTQ
jgi:Leucine-rich repeat (LRR) protein